MKSEQNLSKCQSQSQSECSESRFHSQLLCHPPPSSSLFIIRIYPHVCHHSSSFCSPRSFFLPIPSSACMHAFILLIVIIIILCHPPHHHSPNSIVPSCIEWLPLMPRFLLTFFIMSYPVFHHNFYPLHIHLFIHSSSHSSSSSSSSHIILCHPPSTASCLLA